MHRAVREQLEGAVGISRWIIAVVLDIRDFSRFAAQRESVEISYYLRQTYIKLLDQYFAEADFFKLTGDGLLLVFEHEPEDLTEAAGKVVEASVRAMDDFAGLVIDDPMINFSVPQQVGIGIARGAASKLESAGFTLDYAGRVLNVAARLMDLARPGGIVASAVSLPGSVSDRFTHEPVFMRSVAEIEPVEADYTHGLAKIPARNRRPFAAVQWRHQSWQRSRRLWETQAARQLFELNDEPMSPDEIRITANYSKGRGGAKGQAGFEVTEFKYELHAGKPRVVILAKTLKNQFRQDLPATKQVKITISYPVVEVDAGNS